MITQVKKYVKAKESDNAIDVENFIREYKQKRWVQNSERIGKPDSLSASYTVEELEKFLAEVKAHRGDGVRFYYGAFPEDYDVHPEYAGRQMLVMVGTKSRIMDNGCIAEKNIYTYKNRRVEILNSGNPKYCPPFCPSPDGGMGDLGIGIVDKGSKGMQMF